jgi:hypothetical protein
LTAAVVAAAGYGPVEPVAVAVAVALNAATRMGISAASMR